MEGKGESGVVITYPEIFFPKFPIPVSDCVLYPWATTCGGRLAVVIHLLTAFHLSTCLFPSLLLELYNVCTEHVRSLSLGQVRQTRLVAVTRHRMVLLICPDSDRVWQSW